jgi:hypothetical protein
LFDSWDSIWGIFQNQSRSTKAIQHDFFVWDGNQKLQAWLPYIDRMHKTKENWHVAVDSIILDKIR